MSDEQFQVWPELGFAGKAVPGEVLLPPLGTPAHVNVSLHKLLAAHGQEAEAAKAPTIRGRISMTGAARFSIPESIGCTGRRDAFQLGLALVKLWELAATLMPQLDDEDPFDFGIEIRPTHRREKALVVVAGEPQPVEFCACGEDLLKNCRCGEGGYVVLTGDEDEESRTTYIDDTNTEPLTPEQHEKMLEMGRKLRTGEGL